MSNYSELKKNEFKQIICSNDIKYLHDGLNNEMYFRADEGSFNKSMESLHEKGFILSCLFCEQNFSEEHKFTLFYVFEIEMCENIAVLVRDVDSSAVVSISDIFASASWYEREISDGFGIEFKGNADKRRLFLHEIYSSNFHPLLKSFKNKGIGIETRGVVKEEYDFKKIEGEGVYQIPVGPVHAGIIEPGHFRFSVIGETIYNLEVRMFYKHRGIEKLMEGKKPNECVKIAESVSGDESVANAVAFCMAVEKISGCAIPKRADQLRAIFMELERIYSHLGDMAGMIVDVAFPVGASPFFIMREEVFRQNEKLTGSRFMKGAVGIGGLLKVSNESLSGLSSFLDKLEPRFADAVQSIKMTPSVTGRLETTGIVKKELIKPLNITGPAARACGANKDNRISNPYGIYKNLEIILKTREDGDVFSRFNVKAKELRESIRIIQSIIKNISSGDAKSECKIEDGHTIAVVEAARGQNMHYVDIRNGVVYRCKIRTASFCNWQVIQHAVLGNIVPDFPLINKSLNLSYAGTDL